MMKIPHSNKISGLLLGAVLSVFVLFAPCLLQTLAAQRIADAVILGTWPSARSVFLYGNDLFFAPAAGDLSWVDPQTGKEKGNIRLSDALFVSPLAANGNLYLGSSDGVFKSLSLSTKQENWKYDAKAPILGGPVLHDGRIYFTSSNPGILIALDEKSGKLVYQKKVSAESLSQPVFGDGKIFLLDEKGNFSALDPATGRTLWRYTAKGPVYLPIGGGHGWGGFVEVFRRTLPNPVYGGQRIFFTTAERVYALRASDGNLLWDKGLSRTEIPALYLGEKNLYFLMNIDGTSQKEWGALDSVTGKPLWRRADRRLTIPSPQLAEIEGRVFLIYGADILAVRSDNGELMWEAPIPSKFVTLPVVLGNQLYVDRNGHLMALETATGKKNWEFP